MRITSIPSLGKGSYTSEDMLLIPKRTLSFFAYQRSHHRHQIFLERCLPSTQPPFLQLSKNRKFSVTSNPKANALLQGSETVLNSIHHYTHLPWWAVIVGTTVLLRVGVTLPLVVYQMKLAARQELLVPRLKELQEIKLHNVVAQCRRANLPHTEANKRFQKEAKKVAADLFHKEGCSPYKLYLMPWVQIPLWITLSFTLRNMTGFFPLCEPLFAGTSESMAVEGTLWFQDLTTVDPYFILPILVVITNLLNIQLFSIRRQQVTRRMRIFTNASRSLSIAAGYIGCQFPSAVVLYWAMSSTSALVQNLIVMLPTARRLLSIPKVPSEKERPFRYMLETIQLKTRDFLELQKKN